MATWGELVALRPDLATAGRDLLYQVGVGLAFLSTVRADGGPRLHPFCPVLTDDSIYALVVAGPKRDDLERDGRYAMHSFPCDTNEDAFMVMGTAARRDDPGLRARVVAQFVAERVQFPVDPADLAGQLVFELTVDRVLLTRTTGHGDPAPVHAVWHAEP